MSNEIKLPVWVCESCGSSNVEQQGWIQLNSVNPNITFFETNDVQDFWCNSCEEHVKLIMKEDG